MTDTPRAERRAMTFNPDTQTASIQGIGEFDATNLPAAVRTQLIGQGLITILARVKNPRETYAEMLAGKWGRRTEAAPKPLTDWQRAIHQVKTDEIVTAKRSGGEKITAEMKTAAAAQAEAWVRGLGSDAVTKLKQLAAVKTAHGKLTGVQLSLEEALATPLKDSAADAPGSEEAPRTEAELAA